MFGTLLQIHSQCTHESHFITSVSKVPTEYPKPATWALQNPMCFHESALPEPCSALPSFPLFCKPFFDFFSPNREEGMKKFSGTKERGKSFWRCEPCFRHSKTRIPWKSNANRTGHTRAEMLLSALISALSSADCFWKCANLQQNKRKCTGRRLENPEKPLIQSRTAWNSERLGEGRISKTNGFWRGFHVELMECRCERLTEKKNTYYIVFGSRYFEVSIFIKNFVFFQTNVWFDEIYLIYYLHREYPWQVVASRAYYTRREVRDMSDAELITIYIAILSLLVATSTLTVTFLAYLKPEQKRKKRKKK